MKDITIMITLSANIFLKFKTTLQNILCILKQTILFVRNFRGGQIANFWEKIPQVHLL